MRFSYTDLDSRLIRHKISLEPSFANVFKVNLTKEVFDDIDYRINRKKMPDHIVIIIQGQTGTFKSTSAIEISKMFDKTFTDKQIAFTNQELLNIVKNSHPKNFFIRDEQVKDFGIGSSRIASEVHTMAETLRARANSFIFISPSQINYPAHLTLESFKGNYDTNKNQVALAIKDINSNMYLGSIIVKIHIDNPIWLEYQKRKIAFTEDVTQANFKLLDIEKAAKEIMAMPEFAKCINQAEIFLLIRKTYSNLTVGEQRLINTQIKMFKR